MIQFILSLSITIILAVWNTAVLRSAFLKEVERLPAWAKPVPPALLAVGATLAQGYSDGLRNEALLEYVQNNAGQVGLLAVGLWHVGKRWYPLGKKAGPLLVAFFFTSCLQLAPKYTSEAASLLCVKRIAELPEVQSAAQRKGVPVTEWAKVYCDSSEVILPVIKAVEESARIAKEKALLDSVKKLR